MKISSPILLVVFAAFLLITGCTKKDTPDLAKKSDNQNQISENKGSLQEEKKSTAQSSSVLNYNSAVIKIDVSGKAIIADQLKNLLPKNIAGTEKSKPSVGTIFGESSDVTTSSFTYSFKNGAIVIQVSDYGSLSNIPEYDRQYFNSAPSIDGMDIETVYDNIGKGYIIWDNQKNSGSMYYLLANRFIIKLEGYSLPSGSGGLITYFNMIDRESFINKAKNK